MAVEAPEANDSLTLEPTTNTDEGTTITEPQRRLLVDAVSTYKLDLERGNKRNPTDITNARASDIYSALREEDPEAAHYRLGGTTAEQAYLSAALSAFIIDERFVNLHYEYDSFSEMLEAARTLRGSLETDAFDAADILTE